MHAGPLADEDFQILQMPRACDQILVRLMAKA
jgi:hypothetical protein